MYEYKNQNRPCPCLKNLWFVIIMSHLNWFVIFLFLFLSLLPLSLYPPGLGGAWKVLKLQALWWAVRTTNTPHGSRAVLPFPCNSPPTTLPVLLPTMLQLTLTPLPLRRPWNTEHDPPQAPYNQKFQVQYIFLCGDIYTPSRFQPSCMKGVALPISQLPQHSWWGLVLAEMCPPQWMTWPYI